MSKLKNMFKKPFAIHLLYVALLVGIIVYTIFGDSGLYQLHSLRNTKSDLQFQIKENKTKIELLENEKTRLTNPEYLETIVRKELGYIKEGEVIYQLTP